MCWWVRRGPFSPVTGDAHGLDVDREIPPQLVFISRLGSNHEDRFASEILMWAWLHNSASTVPALGQILLSVNWNFSPPFSCSETPSFNLPPQFTPRHDSSLMNHLLRTLICCLFPCNLKIHRGTGFRTIVLTANELLFEQQRKEERDVGPTRPIGVGYLQVAHSKISQQEKV